MNEKLQDLVNQTLDQNVAEGGDVGDHPNAREMAIDLVIYAPSFNGFSADELTPFIQTWLDAHQG